MKNNKIKKGINLQDVIDFWEYSGGEVMGGHFNLDQYLKFLIVYNNR